MSSETLRHFVPSGLITGGAAVKYVGETYSIRARSGLPLTTTRGTPPMSATVALSILNSSFPPQAAVKNTAAAAINIQIFFIRGIYIPRLECVNVLFFLRKYFGFCVKKRASRGGKTRSKRGCSDCAIAWVRRVLRRVRPFSSQIRTIFRRARRGRVPPRISSLCASKRSLR